MWIESLIDTEPLLVFKRQMRCNHTLEVTVGGPKRPVQCPIVGTRAHSTERGRIDSYSVSQCTAEEAALLSIPMPSNLFKMGREIETYGQHELHELFHQILTF